VAPPEHAAESADGELAAGSLVVLLYGKPGCHLCEQARQALAELAAGGLNFQVEECDITQSPELWERYRYIIPVVDVQGTTLQAPIALHRLEKVIQSAGG